MSSRIRYTSSVVVDTLATGFETSSMGKPGNCFCMAEPTCLRRVDHSPSRTRICRYRRATCAIDQYSTCSMTRALAGQHLIPLQYNCFIAQLYTQLKEEQMGVYFQCNGASLDGISQNRTLRAMTFDSLRCITFIGSILFSSIS